MTAVAGTGTPSGSAGSSETYGNEFSEAATTIGSLVSKLVPGEAELNMAPDLMTGRLVNIAGEVAGAVLVRSGACQRAGARLIRANDP